MTETYPGGFFITSLVTLIFFMHPKHRFSSVQYSFLSTSGGFLLAVVCENMIGVVDLRLRLLDRETAGICSVSLELLFMPTSAFASAFFVGEAAWLISSGLEMSNLLEFLDKEAEEPLLLIILLRDDVAISAALLRLLEELLDRDVGVVHRRLPCLDIGLDCGVGVLDLLLAARDKNFGLQMSSSTLLFSLCSNLGGVIGSCMHQT